jgi:ubiquinone/menaquinone biosynthesis C-methylase UbiE
MLETARRKWDAVSGEEAGQIEYRAGDAHDLPVESASVDAAFAHMVLHSLEEPDRAIREMARIVRPGGQIIVVDFMSHDLDWMKRDLGLLWLGFTPETIREWLAEAGLGKARIQQLDPDAKQDLPASFIAAARKPESETA